MSENETTEEMKESFAAALSEAFGQCINVAKARKSLEEASPEEKSSAKLRLRTAKKNAPAWAERWNEQNGL